ncbi:MAG: hypothetical protein QOF55_1324, partial [Thermoleophilaceae bacterium]|nr:hypothetical protein [Thermoleophilaceae bacterium]
MNRHAIPAAAAALAILAAGCGSGSDSKTATVKPAAAVRAKPGVPRALAGSYTRFVTRADIARTE